jgi:hypothetical protein
MSDKPGGFVGQAALAREASGLARLLTG